MLVGVVLILAVTHAEAAEAETDAVSLLQKSVRLVSTEAASGSTLSQLVHDVSGSQVCSKEKILLHGLSSPYHGTTALEGVMMSSSKVSTMCVEGVPNCELGGFMEQKTGEKSQRSAHNWKYAEAYAGLEAHWTGSRPIMFDKTPSVLGSEKLVHEGFKKAGGAQLGQAYIIMYRPSCLWTLSGHALAKAQGAAGIFMTALTEYTELLRAVKAHKYFLSVGADVLVLNLADLMWQAESATDRIEKWMPCLGKLDACYIPKEGKDVEDHWKVHGSVCSFGKSNSPKKVGYDIQTKTCTKDTLFSHLSAVQRNDVQQAEEYLKSHA